MKRKGQVVNARAYRAGRNLARWVASGCNWSEGSNNEFSRAARAALPLPAELVRLHRVRVSLLADLGQQVTTQSVAGAAIEVAFMGCRHWADWLLEQR